MVLTVGRDGNLGMSQDFVACRIVTLADTLDAPEVAHVLLMLFLLL